MKRVLNVGGNDRSIPIPAEYAGWEHVLLDIDPAGNPDIVCDARELQTLAAASFDSVYCSHNLEHYRRHEVPRVLRGFAHVLRPEGFARVIVPDVGAVMRIVAKHDLDVDDVLYESPAGPITVHDVLYGYGAEIERSGNDWFAHKSGFTARSLGKALHAAGFEHVYSQVGNLAISAIAFTKEPTLAIQRSLGIAPPA
jgi:ubiquinone/menaquinone biosynthesis C-methylase UbiE